MMVHYVWDCQTIYKKAKQYPELTCALYFTRKKRQVQTREADAIGVLHAPFWDC